MITPSWLPLARRNIGVKEILGKGHNPKILEYWKAANVKLNVNDDETPWCAAFVGAMVALSGYKGTGSGRARSYSESKLFIPCQPTLGAITVLSSNRGFASGHVGFLVYTAPDFLGLLGGNQGNAVSEDSFPSKRLVGYYWPVDAPHPYKYGAPPFLPKLKSTGVSDR